MNTGRIMAVVLVASCVSFLSAKSVFAQAWTQTGAPITNWVAIASSADGTKLAAAAGYSSPRSIYTSTNAGASWTKTTAPREYWTSIASSANGTKLVASWQNPLTYPATGGIFASTDSGTTWVQLTHALTTNWVAVACSADGTKLVAVAGSLISVSSDSGATWVSTGFTNFLNEFFTSVACSADGTKMVAVSSQTSYGAWGAIYTSTNSGITWAQQTNAPIHNWQSVASSADGTKLVALAADPYP